MSKAKKALDKIHDEALKTKATEVLKYLDESLDLIGASKDPEGIDNRLLIGTKAITLKGPEMTRAIDAVAKTMQEALRDPRSLECRLLLEEDAEQFVKGLVKMNVTMTAFGANHKELSAGEALAIHRYTGPDYSAMNQQALGFRNDSRLKLLNETCAEALKKMPEYPSVAWPTFRAERAWDQKCVDERYALNNSFTCGVLWSTGARCELDLGKASPKFTHVIYGKTGRDVAALSASTGEGGDDQPGFKAHDLAGKGEVLFASTTKFKVTHRDGPDDVELLRYVPERSPLTVITTKLEEV